MKIKINKENNAKLVAVLNNCQSKTGPIGPCCLARQPDVFCTYIVDTRSAIESNAAVINTYRSQHSPDMPKVSYLIKAAEALTGRDATPDDQAGSSG